MRHGIRIICIGIVFVLMPKLARPQAPAPNEQEVVKRGEEVFAASCTGYCHGANGAAGTGAPALANRGFDGNYIFKTVTYGIEGTAMLGWGQRLPKQAYTAVIEYVKSLNGIVSANDTPPLPLTPTAQHGLDLFSDSAGELTRCSNCHQINGSGVPVAPSIAKVPGDVSALRNLATPGVSSATVNGRSFPAVVVLKNRSQTKVYDLTTVPPVLLSLAPSDVKLSDQSSWKHSSVLGSYSEDELSSILEFLRATAPKQ